MKDGKTLILGIETSCDETAAAVTADGRAALSNIISSQIETHKVFGGVVPEIASRRHLTAINGVVAAALSDADVSLEDIDAVAVTKGPGLVGAVLIGLATAKAIAFAAGKPLIGVHHIRGHIFAVFLEHEDLTPPFLALVVSGGHTSLIDVADYADLREIGRVRDDAAGEAFDKAARVLGLGYPGGPAIDSAAKNGDAAAVHFKRTLLEEGSLDFSFSGLKTGLLNYVNTQKQAGAAIDVPDIAASFQEAIVDVLAEKTRLALEKTGRGKLALCGGVAANSALRARLKADCAAAGISFYLPSPIFCTDNAAMIACAGYYDFVAGVRDSLALDAYAQLSL